MKTSKLYVFRLTVEGQGTFPIDMLRYDRCVPSDGEDAHKVGAYSLEKRRVQLQMYSANKEGATEGRWASFGWKVIAQEPFTIG